MMKRKKTKVEYDLDLKPFSNKHMKLIHWWNPEISPHSNKKIVISDGSIRSGKSVASVYSFLLYTQSMFRHVKNPSFAICGQSMGAIKKNIVEEILLPILDAIGWDYKYNVGDYLQVGNATYTFYGAPNERAQNALQGKTLYGALADESALYPQSFFSQLIGRCSGVDDNGNTGKIFCTCNPLGPMHWFKKDYIDNADDLDILYLHFMMEDNLALTKEYIEQQKKLQKGIFYQRNILGQWVLAEGLVYPMFDKDKHVVDILPKSFSQYYVAIDYGTQNPTVFLLFGRHKNQWYLVKEYYHSGRETKKQKENSEYATDMIKFLDGIKPSAIIIDPSAASLKVSFKKVGLITKNANNDVENGIPNVATSIAKDQILVYKGCKRTIKEFYSYSWDSKAADKGIDKPLKIDDHTMDCYRYFVNTILNKPSAHAFSRSAIGL